MVVTYEIPLTPEPQSFGISLGGKNYRLRVYWNDAAQGGWVMDIALAEPAQPLISGLPLVTGCNLLDGFEWLGIGGELWVGAELPAALDNLGIDAKLYFVTSGAE